MKTNVYKINNSIEKIMHGKSTLFLDGKELNLIKGKLKKKEYQIYFPYEDSDKVIVYKNDIPKIKLFKIVCSGKIRHQDILGAILSIGIDSSYIGDIVLFQDDFYMYILNEISEFIKNNFTSVSKYTVKLIEEDIQLLKDYKREYEKLEINVSSLRIDNTLSSLCNLSRKQVDDKIKNKEVLLNYDIVIKSSCFLKENDIFSIRKYGKYKFVGISKQTKKQKLIIKLLKYI